ncbi:GlmL-related ornithine degradation protein [Tissierella sp. MB52-C2]|uniref:GlmL-related ornithine degradation protein n=1 Tax=Tissierella sp. MB52-C2 TaxID=3070999 RepID=UPI00280ADA71|nr:GlmL-related ornithine degradation protein [Tissierella sp. MB52-C2]WMM23338.1 GlmL-related ornithine degradation protein [Tissierella sp. MB52-C2]
MKIDLLVAEIGSTTTVVNGFHNLDTCPIFIGQGQSATTVLEGDVNIGLRNAIGDLAINLGEDNIEYKELIATSSAAGGLRMTVHGLVYDMTVKAAKEAALGAGANIKYITAGKLRKSDLRKIEEINPNIILIAGGVDYGERDTALYNAELISEMNLNIPVIYAGNIENREDIKDLFQHKETELYIVENVYPKIDELNVEPTRRVIQDVFESHIIHAPGMEKVRNMVTGPIMPTPGAVMRASELLYENIGDLITIDVGGATTDIHSVTEDSDEISRILINPEPKAKRTVEGDLGVYVNMRNIVEIVGREELVKELNITMEEMEDLIENHKPIPTTDLEKEFVEKLTLHATIMSIKRHGGKLKHLYGPSGKKTIAEGKDLTKVKYIIGTGGALTRLPNRKEILKEIAFSNKGNDLLPNSEAEILIDNHYIMASLGVMAKKYPEVALKLLENSLKGE